MDTQTLFDRFLVIAKKHARSNLGPVSRGSVVTELGLDSLALMEAISDFEEELDIMIPDEDLMRLRTLGEFVDRVAALASAASAASAQAATHEG